MQQLQLQELQAILSIQDLRNVQEAQEAEHMPYFCLHVIGNFLREGYNQRENQR
jgi:hypothetical protein